MGKIVITEFVSLDGVVEDPVVLGAGERLFGETSDKKPVRLVDARTVGDGVAILTYEPIRDPGQGERHVPEMTGSEAE